MTKEDLYDWIISQGCKQEQITGINNTANQIKFINPKYPDINAHVYLSTPLNSKPIPDFVVYKICDDLFIPYPDSVSHQKEFVLNLKNKFADKKTL
jgi:hypothetical protein